MELREPLRLEYQFSKDEMLAASKLANKWIQATEQRKHKPPFSRAMLGWILVLSLMILAFLWLRQSHASTEAATTVSARRSGGGVVDVYLSFLPYFLIIVVIWLFFAYRSRKVYGLDKPFTATFTAEGVTWESTGSRVENKWIVFKGFSENATVFVLHLDEPFFQAIPKRILTSEQIKQLRELFQANVTSGIDPTTNH